MPFIHTVSESEASGPVKQVYETSIASFGRIANIVRLLSPDSAVIQSSMSLYASLMKRENALSAERREMLATIVSHANDCYYGTLLHAEDFRQVSEYTEAAEIAEQLIYDYRQAMISDADRALCDYAIKLTLKPGDMSAFDVEHLRQHGFSDDAINIAAQVVSYFNYLNRIADGLGVEPEPEMAPSEETWRALKTNEYGL
ncbi:peroxidase-related enzyme [Verrucomicrobiaceae bacterium N1E253]|uniref:Peroxidase-related enzyme n=1 Tax=Oceaniferula marina TaxID=2748318 RepID=A0A851GG50_9BACT|nr:peroxidase-related enzyme [Oceaniferula marina]NWK54245.1 peroxidase-related enzyme [Oceaniferula marina]